jgi:hypothetical protein
VSIHCYLLEIAISENYEKNWELFSVIDLRSNFLIL